MTSANVYLTYNGNCREAFDFYKSIFGGEYSSINTFSEIPADENWPVPEEAKDLIMHVTLPIGEHSVLMGSDTHSSFGHPLIIGNNFSVSIQLQEREEAERIFTAISADGNITMPMADTFWGAYFGMCIDKFGITWMINCTETSS